jgi:energy-coupling factor transporter ATP-binding protein EcfA2
MKLKRFSSRGHFGVPDGDYDFVTPAGQPHEVVVVTGANGTGKTSLLAAIALAKEAAAPYGSPPDTRGVGSTGGLALEFELSEQERAKHDLDEPRYRIGVGIGADTSREIHPRLKQALRTYSREPGSLRFELIPAERQLSGARHQADAKPEGRSRLSMNPTKYEALLGHVLAAEHEELRRVRDLLSSEGMVLNAEVDAPFKTLTTNLERLAANFRLRQREHGLQVVTRTGLEHPPSQLGSGDRQLLLFASLFAWLRLENSIVLLDHPELYLDDAQAAKLIPSLLTLGVGNQFIVGSASPAILNSVPDAVKIQLGGASPR